MREAILSLPILLAVDMAWIVPHLSMYTEATQAVQGGAPVEVRKVWAAASYACLWVALVAFVLPAFPEGAPWTLRDLFMKATLLGLVLYGVYNFTSLALLKDYSIHVAMKDTLWGGALFTIVTWIMLSLRTPSYGR